MAIKIPLSDGAQYRRCQSISLDGQEFLNFLLDLW